MAEFYAARLRAVDRRAGWPYFASALYSLQPIFTSKVPTLATDRYWRCYVNPAYIESLSPDEAAAVLVHEVGHLLHHHFDRADKLFGNAEHSRASWQHHVANVAQDICINESCGLYSRLPPGCMTSELCQVPSGLTWEEYYAILSSRVVTVGVPYLPLAADADGRAQRLPLGGGDTQPGRGGCGSCAHGKEMPWEEPSPEEGGSPGISKIRGDVIARRVAEDILEHSRDKAVGNLLGKWRRWAEGVLNPRVDWRTELAACVRGQVAASSGNTHPGRCRPSRRQHVNPDIVSLQKTKDTPQVVIVTDTSGSMDGLLLAMAMAEINGLLYAMGPSASVRHMSVDCGVQSVQDVRAVGEVELSGGGGTDMGAGLDRITAEYGKGRHTDVAIVLTDGLTPWPDVAPPYRVVVVLLSAGVCGPKWAEGSERHKVIKVRPENR